MASLRKTLLLSSAAVLLAASAVAPASAQDIMLKFGHILDTEHAVHQGGLAADEALRACTNGEVGIEIFPGGQLGNESELNDMVRTGGVDLANSGTFFLSGQFPPLGVSTLPYIFRDRDQALAYVNSDVLAGLMGEWEELTGQHLMGPYYGAAFHIMSNNPYPNPEDMADEKIRTPNAPAWTVFPASVGAVPTPIAFGEVYLALQQGVVDGSTMPLPIVKSMKFYEVVDYLNMTFHAYEFSFLIVGDMVREKLTDAQWACLEEAALVYGSTAQSINLEREDALRREMTDEGLIEFIDSDLAAYAKASAHVLEEKINAGEYTRELIEAVQAVE